MWNMGTFNDPCTCSFSLPWFYTSDAFPATSDAKWIQVANLCTSARRSWAPRNCSRAASFPFLRCGLKIFRRKPQENHLAIFIKHSKHQKNRKNGCADNFRWAPVSIFDCWNSLVHFISGNASELMNLLIPFPHSYEKSTFIWANYNNSLTWMKAILGWFPLLTIVPVRSQWGRYNSPRFIHPIL